MKELNKPILLLLSLFGLGLFLVSFHPYIARSTPPQYLYDSKRLFACLVLVTTCCLLLFHRPLRLQTASMLSSLNKHTKLCIGVLLATLTVTNVFSEAIFSSYGQLFYLTSIGLFAALLAPFTRGRGGVIIRGALWLNLLLFLNIALFFWLYLYHGGTSSKYTIFTFVNPRFLNQVQIWAFIPIAYLVLLERKNKVKGYTGRVAITLYFMSVFATDARGAFVASCGGLILLSLTDAENRKLWLKILAFGIVAGFVAKLIVLSPLPSIIAGVDAGEQWKTLRTGNHGRFSLWVEAWQIVQFFGHGLNTFVCYSTSFGHPHNSILSILVEGGVIAATAYCALIVLLLKQTFQCRDRQTKVLGASLLTGIALSLVSGVFTMPLTQLLGALTLAAFWGRLSSPGSQAKASTVIPKVIVIFAFAGIAAISFRVIERANHYAHIEHVEAMDQHPMSQFWIGYNCLEY